VEEITVDKNSNSNLFNLCFMGKIVLTVCDNELYHEVDKNMMK
jgi:hypothetical protein